MKNILVTGSAGFIGSSLTLKLLEMGEFVIGVDNHNDYYDQSLKEDRLSLFNENPNYAHNRIDLADRTPIEKLFKKYKPEYVVNLAAQAGVRYSIENPRTYIESNIVGFTNILEECRNNDVKHLVYASSSSVYGANGKIPFSIEDSVDHPLSLYAASKKSNELMAHTYSNLFNLPTTGLRFFTAYGPWGRPDMALFKFTKAILNDEPIDVFNNGEHKRDFTYIGDIVDGITKVIANPAKPNLQWDPINPDPGSSFAPWKVYNIGNNKKVELKDFISLLESCLGKKAKKNLLPLQPGDVPETDADISSLQKDFKYNPRTSVEEGIKKFVDWYLDYYGM